MVLSTDQFDKCQNEIYNVGMSLSPEQVLELCKALGDANRLRIVGLLTHQPLSVEKLAEQLHIGVSTTSHHLSKLARAGVVHASAQGHYSIYSLKPEVLQALGQVFGQPELRSALSEVEATGDKFASKVMQVFTDSEGRIKAFPTQQKKMRVLLEHVLQAFEPEGKFTEKEVNARLERFHADTATLRRFLIEENLMQREGGGGLYWRVSAG